MPQGHEDFSFSANVKTLGADNLVIDKLTVGAYTPIDRWYANNGATATMTGSLLTYMIGKFFARQCRGYIEEIQIYCDNLDGNAHVLTVKFWLAPGIGPLFTFTLNLPASSSTAWRYITVQKQWNYDSLFITVQSDSDTYGRVGRDTGQPWDAADSSDGIAWTTQARRYWIKFHSTRQTVGDLPVNGIVNNIPIPNTITAAQAQNLSIPATGTADNYAVIEGAGKALWIMWYVNNAAARDNLQPRVRVDGGNAMPAHSTFTTWWDYVAELSKGGFFWGKYDTTNNRYTFLCMLAFEFKHKLEIGAYNIGGVAYNVEVGYSLIKIV